MLTTLACVARSVHIAITVTALLEVAACQRVRTEVISGSDGSSADLPGSGGAGSGGAGSGGAGSGGASGAGGSGPRDAGAVETAAPCVNLQCLRVTCPGGAQTSISGIAFAPNGTLPLFNVIVYVPNAPLAPFQQGVSCDRCGKVSGSPIASAISNEEGKFKLNNVPAGKNIPLVVQVGKWRRQVTIPDVVACQDNVLDAGLTRLPRNRKEGDMPRIAATTGTCDRLGCLLPKLGVDVSELGTAADARAVAFYRGFEEQPVASGVEGPPNIQEASVLWRDDAELSKYDMALLSCECREALNNKGPAAYDALTRYLARGGRIFGSDFMYVWYKNSTDPRLAGALSIVGGAPHAAQDPMVIDTSFPKGKALADWMKFIDPTITYGQIRSEMTFANFTGAMAMTSQVWASSPNGSPPMASQPRIVTINTPAGLSAEQQCGRAVHIDAHISPTSVLDDVRKVFPENCGTTLGKAESALAFLFFDLASCIQDDIAPVVPPIIVP